MTKVYYVRKSAEQIEAIHDELHAIIAKCNQTIDDWTHEYVRAGENHRAARQATEQIEYARGKRDMAYEMLDRL